MCILLLDDVVLGVQVPHYEPLEEDAAQPFLFLFLACEITSHLTMAQEMVIFCISNK